MKWVTKYNTNCNERLFFVINGEKIWAHEGVVCPNIGVKLLATQVAFVTVVQFVKLECKGKLLTPFESCSTWFCNGNLTWWL
jgi:hypothetical protein